MAGIQVVNKTDKVVEVAGQKIPAKTSISIHKSFFKEDELKKVKNGIIVIEDKTKTETTSELMKLSKKQLIAELKKLGVDVNGNHSKEKLIEMIENIQAKG